MIGRDVEAIRFSPHNVHNPLPVVFQPEHERGLFTSLASPVIRHAGLEAYWLPAKFGEHSAGLRYQQQKCRAYERKHYHGAYYGPKERMQAFCVGTIRSDGPEYSQCPEDDKVCCKGYVRRKCNVPQASAK